MPISRFAVRFGFVVVGVGLAAGLPAMAQEKLKLTYLANEGVLLSFGARQVIIDGLFQFYGRDYALAPDSVRAALEAARPPYSGIDLLLVTHRHGDHFHPAPIAAHLLANPGAHLLTSPQVIDSLRGRLPDSARVAGRIHPRQVAAHGRRREIVNGITVDLLGLVHHQGRGLAHQGYLVELGGYRILHIGDADLGPNRYEAFGLDTARIDVALVHSGMVTSTEGRRVVEQIIRPRHVVVFHLNEGEGPRMAERVRKEWPKATTFFRPLQEVSIAKQ